MAKNGFNDSIAPKPGKQYKAPWDFRAPPYDERSSCFVNAGSHYGIGHTNPVGHDGAVKQRVPTLPYGKVNVMETSYVPPRQLDVEIIE